MVMSRAIKVDGKVRTDKCYPTGFMGAPRRALAPGAAAAQGGGLAAARRPCRGAAGTAASDCLPAHLHTCLPAAAVRRARPPRAWRQPHCAPLHARARRRH